MHRTSTTDLDLVINDTHSKAIFVQSVWTHRCHDVIHATPVTILFLA